MDKVLGESLTEKVLALSLEQKDLKHEIRALHTMLDHYIEEVLKNEKIHFTTLFTKIAYLSLKHKLTKDLIYFLHKHRKEISNEINTKEALQTARFALVELIHQIEDIPINNRVLEIALKPERSADKQTPVSDFHPFLRVSIFSIDPDHDVLYGFQDAEPQQEIKVLLNQKGKNDLFNSTIRFLRRTGKFPVILHLERVEITSNHDLIPESIIFEPDYLIDVTTVSECFKPSESNPLFYFIKKFIPVFQNKYLIIGNIANFFLDELFYDSNIVFSDLIKKTFRLSPLGFSMMNDGEIKEIVSILKKHFYTIKSVIVQQLAQHNISPHNGMIEPSFYAPKYGFQGRLDLFSVSPDRKEAAIVELKSGKPYRPNAYGLNINHYVQTLLYDLMVNAVTDRSMKVSSFILYSSQTSDALRFAPPVKAQQREAIKLRNQLVEIDYLLADIDLNNDQIFSFIQQDAIKTEGFSRRDIIKFQTAYESADPLTLKYFNAFTAFVAREQILAKTGEFGLDKSSGLAGLWLDDMQEKIDNFLVLNALEIKEVKVELSNTIIKFIRTEATATNANFRKGDLGVLYPYTDGNRSVLSNQIYKCSVIDLNQDTITVRLRNKQQNVSVFESKIYWHIEHDHLDHGFNAMYQDLFLFLCAKEHYRSLLLGLREPVRPNELAKVECPSYLTSEQQRILSDMVNTREYYLLWGPPGTGKTSVVLHEYLKHVYKRTEERVLVIAYTNRAVDEICEAISRIDDEIKSSYFRVGSRYSTHTKFTNDLLVTKLEEIENRYDLLSLIKNSRIIVSTLASIQGKKEIFSLVSIDTIIVDEASQILEPQLIGFLSNAPKFILIGDHYQLPAIVRQRPDESEVYVDDLINIGLTERRNSLFERLYRRCESKGWEWSIGRLSQQGRMHRKIMDFVNMHFYEGFLSVISSKEELMATDDALYLDDRFIYIPVDVDKQSVNFKTNSYEASIIAGLIKDLIEKQHINHEDIGVITPYRAQISAIKKALNDVHVESPINVDTVERYQGSARDIIILSMCLNIESQLKQLVNMSTDGIDRKLNVALTRARNQIIVLGNEHIMRKNKVYSQLIDYAKKSPKF